MKQTLGQLIRRRKAHVPFADMMPEQRMGIDELIHPASSIGWDGSILLTDFTFTTSHLYTEQRAIVVKDSTEREQTITTTTPRRELALRFRCIVANQPEAEEHYALTASTVLMCQASQDFTREDLPLPTRIAERRSHRGRTYLVFE